MQAWYVAVGGQRTGPHPLAELRRMISLGQLKPSDHLLPEGSQKWIRANSIPNLFDPRPTNGTRAPRSPAPLASEAKKVPTRTSASPPSTPARSSWGKVVLVCVAGLAIIVGLAGDDARLRSRLSDNEVWLQKEKANADARDAVLAEMREAQAAGQRDAIDLRNRAAEQSRQTQTVQTELRDALAELVAAKAEVAAASKRQSDDSSLIDRLRTQIEDAKRKESAARKDQAAGQDKAVADLRQELEKAKREFTEEVSRLVNKAKEDGEQAKKLLEEEQKESEKLRARVKVLESARAPARALDKHALAAPKEAEESMETLAKYLTLPARTDREKFRAIFRWTADRIVYDAEGFLTKNFGDNSAEAVLKNRKSVCAGYSNLMKRLGRLAGLEIEVVSGYGKIVSANEVDDVSDANHAWNAVKLEGKWNLCDATWCAGYIADKKFVKHFDETFYLARPDEFLLSHNPSNPKWQLMEIPYSEGAIGKLMRSKINPLFFRLGFSLKETVETLEKDDAAAFVEIVQDPKVELLVREAPMIRFLRPGQKAVFRFESDKIKTIAILNNNRWTRLERNESLFSGEIQAVKGPLIVGVKTNPLAGSFDRILKYAVE